MPTIRNSPSQQRLARSKAQPRPSNEQRSRISESRGSEALAGVDRLVQLHERLKNIHHFYKTRIEEEKGRTAQRNEVFLGMAEEMQRSQAEKVEALRVLVEEAEGERKEVGAVDDKMTEIKSSIDDLLKQSSELKAANEQLERTIAEKDHSCREKEEEARQLREDLMEARNELESFERLNLKENKRTRELVALVDGVPRDC